MGGWMDIIEANLLSPQVTQERGLELYTDLLDAFKLVASPFADYQLNFVELETRYSGASAKILSDDVRGCIPQATPEGTTPLSQVKTLQETIRKVQELSVAIFPVVESTVARFELLDGGYGTTQALVCIDNLLAGHVAQVTTAIQTISSLLTADEKKLAESFEEPYASCALEGLKAAGSFRRALQSFASGVRKRLGLLAERMASHSIRFPTGDVPAEGTAARGERSNQSFSVPDSMSMVDIDCYLTRAVLLKSSPETESQATVAMLRGWGTTTDEPTAALLPDTSKAFRLFASKCHSFVYVVCSSVATYHLGPMPLMGEWKGVESQVEYASGGGPQQYVTNVGEHMLTLVQVFEPFASNKSNLDLANEVMDQVREVSLQPWLDFVNVVGCRISEAEVRTIMNGTEIRSQVLGFEPDLEDEEDEPGEDADKEVSDFCNAWLDAVGLGVTGRILEKTMRIPQLSAKGCEQLNIDLGYLMRALSALGIPGHPHPLLGHFSEVALLSDVDLSKQIGSRDRSKPTQSVLRSIEERLAAMRGAA
jgi:conserved oligomeric Golgi complex subunit 7